ncbi:MAG: 16S rRNA (guanine(966)-N(2))-methyltransferase RsmD [Clostridia bacterium]|nr:16S rRNA (guanine(966)-N(2))-methyltransferase RsmD [Clostridia bacterium]
MRIVGGTLRGRKLNTFKGNDIRPTADNVRESLFNILGEKTKNSRFLDLFCGTGAVGIEALSRGAKSVTFNDLSKESVSLTKKNLISLGVSGRLSQNDGVSFLGNTSEKFDIVYIDPPYKSGVKIPALNKVSGVLESGGIAVLEDESPFIGTADGLILTDVRKYGRVYLNFFEKKEDGAAVFAGTFDPVTEGHFAVVTEAVRAFGKVFAVLGVNPEKTPFFTREERKEFLAETFKDVKKVEVLDFADFKDVEEYAKHLKDVGVKYYVRGIRDEKDFIYEKKAERKNLALYGGIKTAYILCGKEFSGVSASKVKKNMLSGKEYKSFLPQSAKETIARAFENKGKTTGEEG